MRISSANLYRDTYDAVASRVLSAMKGESGAFHVYVASDGVVRVLHKLHKTSASREEQRDGYGDLVGTYTASTPLEYIEDDMLETKRRRSITHGRNQ